jgi:hypothetical protein
MTSLCVVGGIMAVFAAITWLDDRDARRRKACYDASQGGGLSLCELPKSVEEAVTQGKAVHDDTWTPPPHDEVVLACAFHDFVEHAPHIVGLTDREAMQIGLLASLRDSGHMCEWYGGTPGRARSMAMRHAQAAANFLIGADDDTYTAFKRWYWDA